MGQSIPVKSAILCRVEQNESAGVQHRTATVAASEELAPLATSPVDLRVIEACHRIEARLSEVASEITSHLRAREPSYGLPPLEELSATVYSNIAGLLETVRLNRITTLTNPRLTGRRRAEHGIPLPTVLSGYRLGVMHVWRELVDACAAIDSESGDPSAPASRALLDSATVLWTAFDLNTQELAAEYRAFEAEVIERDHARRGALLAALFNGESVGDLSVVEVAQRLRMPPTGPFVVVMADPGVSTRRTTSRRIAELLGAPCAWRTGAQADIGLIAPQPIGSLERLVERLTALRLGRVGISEPFDTLHNIARAVDQARQARVAGPSGDQVLVTYDTVRIGSLLMSGADRAADLEDAVLSGLLHLAEAEQEVLLTTLSVWFASGGAAERAAQQLLCHPNTVRYRLGKLTRLTNRNLKDPLDLVHLHLAMENRRIRGSVPAHTPSRFSGEPH